MLRDLLKPFVAYEADAGAGSGSNNADPDKEREEAGDSTKVTFSAEQQAAIDKLVTERLARQEKSLRKTWAEEAESERRKAEMAESDRLKAEKQEAIDQANERIKATSTRLVRACARAEAAAAGVKAERLDKVLKLAELDSIELDDSGEPDPAAVRLAVEAVLRDVPELVSKSNSPNIDAGSRGENDRPDMQTLSQMSMADYLKHRPTRG